jgi:outer membrane lipoprotein carrier protein
LKRIVTAVFLSFLVSGSPLHARQLTPVEGLEALRSVFAGMNGFSADITQEKQVRLLKKKIASSGIIRFRKPGSFYMELYSPYASRVLLQDTALTMSLTAEGVRQRIVLPPEQGLNRWISALSKPMTQVPEGVEVRGEEKDGRVRLQILPRKKGQLKELGIVLENGELKSLAMEEENGNRTLIRLHKVRRNPPFSDADFRVE